MNIRIAAPWLSAPCCEKFVVIGGAVPWLLLPHARPQHIGTLDIDLDLDTNALSDGEYATLIETLQEKGYEFNVEGLRPFQLRRWVNLDDVEPVAVLVDLLMPRNAKTDKNKEKLIAGLRVQGADGGHIALTHHVTTVLEGPMPDGRPNRVTLLVASIPALLVMKGYALTGRDKKKDAYDIYFSVRNYDGGPAVLADASRELLHDPVAVAGFKRIADKFRNRDDYGPQTVKLFLQESSSLGDMTPDQVQMDAFMQVAAFLKALRLANG
jgi:hypothetical protein